MGSLTKKGSICLRGKGLIPAPPALVFSIVYDVSRLPQWDSMVNNAKVVTSLDHNTLLVHSELVRSVFPSTTKFTFSVFPHTPRDLCFALSYQEFTDGTFVVVLCSIDHPLVPDQEGFIRGFLHPSGFVIRPALNKHCRSSEVDCSSHLNIILFSRYCSI